MRTTSTSNVIVRRVARARRWLWTSMVAAVAVAVVMVGGLFTFCQFGIAPLGQLVVGVCCGGTVSILFDWRAPRANEMHYGYANWTGIHVGFFPKHSSGWELDQVLGFGMYPRFRVLGHQINVTVPWWITLLLCLLTAFLARRSAVRWRRLLKGICAGCGYDLTGNTSGRCPECGRDTEP